jgi:hypothetical protein
MGLNSQFIDQITNVFKFNKFLVYSLIKKKIITRIE